jgi:hypothetical protein
MTTIPTLTMAVETACGTVHILYHLNGKNGKEMRIDEFDFRLAKSGICARTHLTALSSIISTAEKNGSLKLQEIINILKGQNCSMGDNRTKNQKCCLHAIAISIEDFINKEKK